MGIRRARTYTEAERRGAVEEARCVGATAASRKLGIPAGTLSCWLFLAKVRATQGGGAAELSPPPESDPAPVAAAAVSSSPVSSGAVAAAAPAKPRAHVAKVYTPSQRAEIIEYAAKHGPTAAGKKFGASRFSIRDWKRKTAAAAAGGTAPAPTTGPDTNPADERERRVLHEWRAHPGLGPSQVRNQLRRAGYKVSVHSCRVVMEKHGYVTPTTRRQDARATTRRGGPRAGLGPCATGRRPRWRSASGFRLRGGVGVGSGRSGTWRNPWGGGQRDGPADRAGHW